MIEMEDLGNEIPFDWNSSFRLIDLANAVAKLKLPRFSAQGHVTLSDATEFGGEWGGEWGEESVAIDQASHATRRSVFDYSTLRYGSKLRDRC